MAATISVRRMAESASGSMIAFTAARKPLASADANTVSSGSKRKTPIYATDTAIRTARVVHESSAGPVERRGTAATAVLIVAPARRIE